MKKLPKKIVWDETAMSSLDAYIIDNHNLLIDYLKEREEPALNPVVTVYLDGVATVISTPPEEQNIPLGLREEFNKKFSDTLIITRRSKDAMSDFWLARMSEQRTALIERVKGMKLEIYPELTGITIATATAYNKALDDVKKLL